MEPSPFRRPVAAEPPSLNSLVRAIIAQAHGTLDRSVRAADHAAAAWPNDPAVPLLLRAAVTPTLMANASALQPITIAFVEALAPLSASGELVNRGIALTSLGRGQISVPSFAPGQADFVAEGQPIPVKQFVSSGPVLTPFKLATIAALTAEMIESSDAETLVRAVLTESVALGLDSVLFSNQAAVAGLHPAGLLAGIAALTPAAAGGGKTDTMATDLAALLTAIAPYAGAGYLIVAAEAQAVAMQFRLLQPVANVRASSALPAGTVIAIAPRAFVSAMEPPRIDASIEALVHMDSAPTAIGTAGAPAVVAAPTRSLYQTNTVGLRLITPVSWALRAAGAVAWMQSVNW